MAVTTTFATIEEAIADIRDGRFVVVVDDPDRENEGDLVIASQFVTPEAINFMATHARGLICLCLTEEKADILGLRPMTDRNEAPLGTAFTVSIEAREGVTTGISAADRSHTVQVAIAPDAKASDLVQPGHVFPLRARPGGVLERIGQTEAAVDLARLAGLNPSGVICEIMNDDGSMARMPDLEKLASRHDIPILRIADLIAYRRHERQIRRKSETVLPTRKAGEFRLLGYSDDLETTPYVALVKGSIKSDTPTLVRLHSQCLTGDVFGSERCDCGEQLEAAMAAIAHAGSGVVVYMFDEGRGIGLLNKIRAYALQDQGHDTVEANHVLGFAADMRDFKTGAHILFDLGVRQVRLMTNNPDKVKALEEYGLKVTERVSLEVAPRKANRKYLQTKRAKFGHLLSLVGQGEKQD